jgi:hypothetical protein
MQHFLMRNKAGLEREVASRKEMAALAAAGYRVVKHWFVL